MVRPFSGETYLGVIFANSAPDGPLFLLGNDMMRELVFRVTIIFRIVY